MTTYIPTEFVMRGSSLRLKWLKCGTLECKEPFFAQTESRLIDSALESQRIETDVDALIASVADEHTPPSGFIFHTSRCGSTLLSNMLGAVPEHLVLSEPPALLSLLDGIGHRLGGPALSYTSAVASTIYALARPGMNSATRYFIKFFSQNIHLIDLVRQSIPGVPELFLYRDPLEVLIANLGWPNQDWIWRATNTGLDLHEAVERSVSELFARGIGRTMQAMVDHASPTTLLMNYADIGRNTPLALLEFFGVPASASALDAMNRLLAIDSKDGLRLKFFRSDTQAKRASASQFLIDLIDDFAELPFKSLEHLRVARTLC